MKKLAVIGSNGMLGSDLVRYLSSEFEVTPINKENYAKHIGSSFDVIINANGNSKRFWANEHPVDDFTASTLAVYKSIFDFTCSFYIYISSSDIYEDHSTINTTKEEQHINPQNLSSYGLHKYFSEIIVQKYIHNYIILRSSMILGENLKKGPIYDILQNKSLYVTKNSYLQMITTEEIASIIVFLLKGKNSNRVFNVGGKGRVSFEGIDKYFSSPISFDSKAQLQEYEMNTVKLQSVYPIKTSEEYLKKYLKNKLNL